MESQAVQAQTEAALKSTGGAAKITANEVSNLATKIAMKSGIDDEAIQSGENLLLTFTNIRNEAGRGNDIFNQSTQILTDMSVAMGTDVSSQALVLGKAMNDPVRGVSALTRVGVTFTEGQKESIKSMVEMGNTAGAQKIILGELTKEFGGSADAAGKTMAGQMNIAKVAIGNLSEDIGAKLLPAFSQAMAYAIAN